MQGFYLNCNYLATAGLVLDGVVKGIFDDIYIDNPLNYGLLLKPTSANTNTMFNRFSSVHVHSLLPGSIGICVDGTAVANSCHNLFEMTEVEYDGAASEGIRLDRCDNNTFLLTYIYRNPGATGAGVHCVSDISDCPGGNQFYHLEAGAGGWVQDSNINGNFLFGYMTDNGEPDPVTNGGRLYYINNDFQASPITSLGGLYTKPGLNVAGVANLTTGLTSIAVTFPFGNEPDAGYTVFASPSWATTWYASNIAAGGFTINFGSATSGNQTCGWLIVRTA
jgi:hypothetical protein